VLLFECTCCSSVIVLRSSIQIVSCTVCIRVSQIFVPGTLDEVEEELGIPCRRNMENILPTFVLMVGKKVCNIAWLYSF
jgi:hypothetical protein